MAIPFTELNKINPSSIIELFELELTVGVHIPTGNPNNLDTVFRFHAGANLNNLGQIRFNNNDYQRVAVKMEGFEDTSSGTIKRPTMTFSNRLPTVAYALGGITKDSVAMNMTTFLNVVNLVTAGNDLLNAKVTRLLPLASALDNANFIGDNPFGTPSTDRLQDRIYYIDRKALENREVVQFELVSAQDLENKKLPARIVTREFFPAVGTFI